MYLSRNLYISLKYEKIKQYLNQDDESQKHTEKKERDESENCKVLTSDENGCLHEAGSWEAEDVSGSLQREAAGGTSQHFTPSDVRRPLVTPLPASNQKAPTAGRLASNTPAGWSGDV